jgi:ABC-type nitrate/sulfonate/bicarbonate transport system substrate-binding protein
MREDNELLTRTGPGTPCGRDDAPLSATGREESMPRVNRYFCRRQYLTKRRTMVLLLGFFVFFALSGRSAFPQQESIRIGYSSPSFGGLAMFVAQQKGIFKKYSLNVEFVRTATAVGTLALVNRELDYLNGVAQAVSAAMRGLPVRLVLVITDKPQYLIISKPEYRSLNNLKGKTIGTSNYGSTSHLLLQTILQRHGMVPGKDVYVLPVGLGGQAQLAAIQAGKTEAGVSTPPTDIEGKKLGYNVILRMSDVLSVPVDGLGITLDKLRRQPDQVKKVIMSVIEGARFIKDNREESVGLLAGKWLQTSQDNARHVYGYGIDWISKSWGLDPAPIDAAISLEKDRSQEKRPVAVSEVSNMTLAQEALKLLDHGK